MKRIVFSLLIIGLILIAACAKREKGEVGKVTLNIGMQDEPKQLNPFKASDVWSWHVLGFLYESLYTRNPETFEIIPWLAEGEPEYDKETRTCIVHLRKGVKWEDGAPFTAQDVVFTAQVLIDFKIPRYISDWDFVERVEAVDDYTLRFTLKEPFVIFFTATLMSLIVPKHIWEPIIKEAEKTENPLATLLDYEITAPIGMGPFKFVQWRKGSYVKLARNPNYFATGREVKGRKVGPFIDEILFKIYRTTDTAILALQKGEIDYIWWAIQPGFIRSLRRDKSIEITNNPENGLRYLAFNLRRPPFNDINFRQAVAYLIDKQFIQTRVLQNYGQALYSIVPPGNKFWFNPDTRQYGKEMSRAERVRKAIEILKEANYRWNKPPAINDKGEVIRGEGLIMLNGKPVPPFTILTPPADYDPLRAMCGMLIQEWLREIGIPATSTPTSFGDIVNKVNTEWNFDTYLLGWKLGIDPDHMRTFFHSKEVVRDGYNSMGYINQEFDKLADASAREMDEEKRREIIFKMQEFIVEEAPYIPLFTSAQVEAYRKDRFTGWVNQLDGIGNGWSFLFLQPYEPR